MVEAQEEVQDSTEGAATTGEIEVVFETTEAVQEMTEAVDQVLALGDQVIGSARHATTTILPIVKNATDVGHKNRLAPEVIVPAAVDLITTVEGTTMTV